MEFWPSLAVIICLFLGLIVLLWHTAIDLKLRLLPDELNIALAVLGVAFHWAAAPYGGTWVYAALGAVLGAGLLALVRANTPGGGKTNRQHFAERIRIDP